MKTAKTVIILLILGVVMTFVADYFNLHKGLEHMQHESIWGYVVESLMYSGFYALVWGYVKSENR